jgi:hypothetical protein
MNEEEEVEENPIERKASSFSRTEAAAVAKALAINTWRKSFARQASEHCSSTC